MSLHSATARLYRVTEIFLNGTVILDAEDDLPDRRRRVATIAEMPENVQSGVPLVCHSDGRYEPLDALEVLVANNDVPAQLAREQGLIGDTIRAAVMTVADVAQVTPRVAAHIMAVWLQAEYAL